MFTPGTIGVTGLHGRSPGTTAPERTYSETRMVTFRLSTGAEIPVLGLGTWQSTGNECRRAVKHALDLGYTHIDTAVTYDNQHDIGQALKEYGADRDSLFITSKIPRDHLRAGDVESRTDAILSELMTEYLDLLLIHWPNPSIPLEETLSAFSKLVRSGKVRNIGVSNFPVSHLKKALAASEQPITVNQVEFHPLLNQEELLAYCRSHKILVMAYSPIARGEVFNNRLIGEIAEARHKTPVQISLRWLVQKGLAAIPKATKEEHLRSNIEIFDFELSSDEMQRLDTIPDHRRLISGAWAGIDLDE